MKLQALTNTRPSKDLGTEIIFGSPKGTVKLTPRGAKALGIGNGDYIGIVGNKDGVAFVFKGSDEGYGSKMASSNKGGGGTLTGSAAAAWAEFGDVENYNLTGDVKMNRHYTIAEEVTELSEEDKAENPEFANVELHKITFAKEEEKQARKSKDDGDDEDGDDTPVTSSSEGEMNATDPAQVQGATAFDDL